MPTSPKGAFIALATVFACVTSSCSLALSTDENQCDKDGDCSARGFMNAVCASHVCIAATSTSGDMTTSTSTGSGGALPAGWGCIGNFKYPDTMGKTVTQQLLFVDALSQEPVSNIKMNLCGPLDGECKSPTMTNLKPDASGNLSVDIPMMPGFYLDIKDATDPGGGGAGGSTGGIYRDSIAYLGSPVVLPPNLKTIRLISNDGLKQLASILGKTEDTTHGVAVVLTPNCEDQRSAGVLVTTNDVDAESQELYFKNSLPNQSATETDAEGAVGFFNLPAGTPGAPRSSTFTTRLETPACMANPTTCDQIGTATVFIRPKTLTYVHIGPSP